MTFPESRWIEFEVVGHRPRTLIVDVRNKRSGAKLGQIRWYAPWRCYAIMAEADTIWNPDCLQTVIEAMGMLERERKEGTR